MNSIKTFFKKLFSPMVLLNLLGMVLFLVIVFLAFNRWTFHYTHHNESIEVPNVVGMMGSDACYTLQKAELVAIIADSLYDKTRPAGSILAQMPAEGTPVKTGREIYLTVNCEQMPTMVIPDVADNSSFREAEAKLKGMGFKLGPVEYVPGEKNWVYGVKSQGRNVYAGDRVPIDVPLILQVGNNKEESIENEEDEENWHNDAEADPYATGEDFPLEIGNDL